jgi:2-polyprenyl-6-methoxyphenol hydroxylase-like FAD-dependent oxidoreductase
MNRSPKDSRQGRQHHLTDEGELSDRPEIARHALTEPLTLHLSANQIKWNHKLFSATSSTVLGHTEIELDFRSHGKQSFDFAIGADGCWSKVRNLLTDVKPHYTGVQGITLTIRNVTKKYPHLADLVGLGSFAALANHHGIMSHRGPQDSARLYVILTTDDENFADTTGLASQPATVVRYRVLEDVALLGS